jgi:hypothetical protein
VGAAPVGHCKLGSVAGKVSRAGVVGLLGESSTSACTLRVRRSVGLQSADERGHKEGNKIDGLVRKA